MSALGKAVLASIGLALGAAQAHAEPMFISRQYARCTTCHYSATGGGMLTPYGRSLSRQELSTTGKSRAGQEESGTEQDYLWGLLGNKLGPLSVSLDLRPSHLNVDASGPTFTRDFFMNGDLLAAYQARGWTIYGEIGREPPPHGPKIDSYEYWVAHQWASGFGVRVGRFMPAYGIHLADHTAFTRGGLGFDHYDQVYGLELSHADEHRLLQLSVAPGLADSIINNDGRRAFTTTGRFQYDLSPRTAVVASALFRNGSQVLERSGASGLAFGFAPARRVSVWTQADARFQAGALGGTAYTLLNETSVEVYRGLWLKFSPQLRTDYGNTSGGFTRLVFEADLFPRTHWNIDVSYYRDRSRVAKLVSKTFLAQLHLYL